jgi:hypothetical protein
MSDREVRVLTRFNPREFYTVPSTELPPGLVRIHIKNDGEFYAVQEVVTQLSEGSGFRHPPFSDAVRAIFSRLQRAFNDLMPMTVEEWEDGFRKDTHPWREIALWELWADGMVKFTGHITGADAVSKQKRRDIFGLLRQLNDLPHETKTLLQRGTAALGTAGSITANRAKEITGWYFAQSADARRTVRANELLELIAPAGPIGPERVPISALLNEDGTGLNLSADFDPRDLIAAVDVILAVDVVSGTEVVVFGRPGLEEITSRGEAGKARVLRVELDHETDELETLLGVVQAVRGRHDYRAG